MTTAVISIIRVYQLLVSPLLPSNTCRFHPTCSQYAIDAVKKNGVVRGLWRAFRRIIKCHPWHPGGFDPA